MEQKYWISWWTLALLIGSCGAPPSELVATMPNVLRSRDGETIDTREQWLQQRRPEILELFRKHMYGRAPDPSPVRIESASEAIALDGKAVRKQWRLRYADADEAYFEVLLYLPKDAKGPVPTFLALNFFGNQSVHSDQGIRVTTRWVYNDPELKIQDNRATEALRGAYAERWPIEKILARGYGVATVHYADIDPDYDDGFKNGVHGVLDAPREGSRAGHERADDAWGAIGAWAWGLSRVLDGLEQDDDVDQKRVLLLGHSRLGKTALWAGAQDERFAMVIANDSGCGGAAYGRRQFGESIASINKAFPHWFNRAFRAYADREYDLPVDQHLLIAAIAPRPAYVASAELDAWADPLGEFLSVVGAAPAYRLLGTEGLPTNELPKVDQPVHGQLGYHNRSGSHDLTWRDWEQFLAFADRHLKR